MDKCITEGCNESQYWGKYCKRCYHKEFEANRSNIAKTFRLGNIIEIK